MMNKFITAYCWMFGGTKTEAKIIFKCADQEYIKLIIDIYNKQTQKSFYED